MNIHYIYGLVDPVTNLVRYVGQTNNIDSRYRTHREGKYKTTAAWAKSLQEMGLYVGLTILATTDELNIDSQELYWIKQFPPPQLLNIVSNVHIIDDEPPIHPAPQPITDKLKSKFELKNFIPLPSDSNTPLTKEQLDAVFPLENREGFIRELIKLARKSDQS